MIFWPWCLERTQLGLHPHRKNCNSEFFSLYVGRQFTTWYLLVLSQVHILWYYWGSSQRSEGSRHFFDEPRGIQQMHMLTLLLPSEATSLLDLLSLYECSEPPICFPVFFSWTCKTALRTEFYYQKIRCLFFFFLCSWYLFWLCSNEWHYFYH